MDWNPRHLYRKIFNGDVDAMERFMTEVGFAEWNLQQDKGRAFGLGVAELSAKFPDYAHFIRAYDERWEESLNGPIHRTVDVLRALKERGYRLYGLSNWSAEKFQLTRAKYEFFTWFDAIVLSGEVNLVKPEPEIYQHLLNKIGLSAEQCVFIDDSAPNIVTANRLGFMAIRFESPEQLETDLKRLGLL